MQYLCKFLEPTATSRTGGLLVRGPPRTERQPVHLLFVLDTSGSMEENDKLIHVKRSIAFLLPYLTSADQLSLITFSGHATTHLMCVPVTPENKCAIEYTIGRIEPQDSTNLAEGLLATTPILQVATAATHKQGIILLTDGYVNDGVRDESLLLEIVKSRLKMFPGLSVSCIAYGQEHNADLLSKIAMEGGGSYTIVQNLEDVASVFGEILGGLLSIVAQMVEVRLPPGMTSDAPFPKEIAADGATTYRIGDLYAEAEQVILFEAVPSATGPIQITGITLPTFAPFQDERSPEPMADSPEPALLMASVRQQVCAILKQYRTAPASAELRAQAAALAATITASAFHASSLAVMMLEDLTLVMTVPATHDLASQTLQHETYLGTARGLRTPSRPTGPRSVPPRLPHRGPHGGPHTGNPRHEDEEAAETAENPIALSIFSNTVQRNLTTALRTVSQQPDASAVSVGPTSVAPASPLPDPHTPQ